MVTSRHILFLSLVLPGIWAGSVKHPVISLDIGRKDPYNSDNHEVKVEKCERDGQVFYHHALDMPSKLSEITVDGHYIHADLFPFRDELVLSSLVYWRYDKPDMLTLNLENSQVFLWNNGNGRLVPKASTLDDFGATKKGGSITIDIAKDKRYVTNGNAINVVTVENEDLKGFMIYRHTARPFIARKIVDGRNEIDITVGSELLNIYVYKWNKIPLLLDFELVTDQNVTFAYIDNKWTPVKIPKRNDPKRRSYIAELVEYVACRMGRSVFIDIGVISHRGKYSGKCRFPNMKTVNGATINTEITSRHYSELKGYVATLHVTSPVTSFHLKYVVRGKNNIDIDILTKPIRGVMFLTRAESSGLLSKVYDMFSTDFNANVIVMLTNVFEYFIEVKEFQYVKFAESNKELKTVEELEYIPNEVIIWKDGKRVGTINS
ncbi:signal peptide containing protein [Theileria equi strain WA]|uniref:Signal peptide containing protein n=1 Tax=Theileria equi strain WA TaxID=1537102 RepID=L1LBR4_THEEQ|nr:signal peptide containing protein [Theileria equi strain WA]EKX72714.1 signal peptide containing protein [Theileria equi strain WA]|eukprot:XP_004832166.1 signal peptide containing protein [Theileria equi strain WA]